MRNLRTLIAALSAVATFTLSACSASDSNDGGHTNRVTSDASAPAVHRSAPPTNEPTVNAPLLTYLHDLSTIPNKGSATAKAADPCKVIPDAAINRLFANREVTFYHPGPNKGRPVPNNPQLIRFCDYTGIMMNGKTRVNMTFQVTTSLDNASHEDWKLRTKDLKQHDYVDSNIFGGLVIGGYTGHKGQVIVEIMPTSANPGITDQDALALTHIALSRLP